MAQKFQLTPVDHDPFGNLSGRDERARAMSGRIDLSGLSQAQLDKVNKEHSLTQIFLNDLGAVPERFGNYVNHLLSIIPEAASGGYSELYADPETGRVLPINPRLIDAANEVAGVAATGGMAMPRPANSLGVFGGTMAKTANHYQLRRAVEREDAGVSPESIFRDTGWFRGVDDKWRFEIPDSEVKVDLGPMNVRDEAYSAYMEYRADRRDAIRRYVRERFGYKENVDFRDISREHYDAADAYVLELLGEEPPAPKPPEAFLGDVMDHPLLFEAYPGMKNIKLSDNVPMGARGVYRPNDTVGENIGLSAPGFATPERMPNYTSTLLHEIQHGIQSREGFAMGGASTDPQVAQYGEQLVQNIVRRRAEISNKTKMGQTLTEDDLAELLYYDKALPQMKKDYGQTGYHLLAGEAEARNVQTRYMMDLDEKTSPGRLVAGSPYSRRWETPLATSDVPFGMQINRLVPEWAVNEMAAETPKNPNRR